MVIKSYIKRKEVMENKNLEIDKMKEDLNNVKGELGEIKGSFIYSCSKTK